MSSTSRPERTGFHTGAQTGSDPGASGAMEDVKARASDVAGTAKDVAADAGEQLKITIEDQKRAGAHHIARFAQAVQSAADQLDRDTPELARYVRGAADQVQQFSQTLRERDVRQLFDEVQSFARRHPTAFLGATALVGFGLARFFKSAGGGDMRFGSQYRTSSMGPGSTGMGGVSGTGMSGTAMGSSGMSGTGMGGTGMGSSGMGSSGMRSTGSGTTGTVGSGASGTGSSGTGSSGTGMGTQGGTSGTGQGFPSQR